MTLGARVSRAVVEASQSRLSGAGGASPAPAHRSGAAAAPDPTPHGDYLYANSSTDQVHSSKSNDCSPPPALYVYVINCRRLASYLKL